MTSAIPWHAPVRTLAQFGSLCAVVFGGWGITLLSTSGASAFAATLLAGGVAAGLLGLLRPAWLRPVFVGWMILVFPIGWTVSHLLLGLLFFCVFTPVACLLRVLGKDSLQLQRKSATSWWQNRVQEADLKRYLRQY